MTTLTQENMDKPFSIGTICREDILDLFEGDVKDKVKFKKEVEELNDGIIQDIAWCLGEHSADGSFWNELKDIVENKMNIEYNDE